MEKLQKEGVARLKQTFGVEHSDTIDAIALWAEACQNLGDCGREIQLYTHILAYRRRYLTPDHEDILQVMKDLATAHVEMEGYEKAIPLREELLEVYRRVADENGEDFISVKIELAGVYWWGDRLNEAEAFEVLETRNRLCGEEDQATLDAMQRHTLKKKSYDKAEALYLRLLATRQKISTMTFDIEVLKVPKHLEDMYFLAGRYGEAKKYAATLLYPVREHAPRNNGKGVLSALTGMRDICAQLK
ncbi:uncharacterized protein RSE6_03392 [Rhynchosporium secalis]|uniref:Kinesin light chain n=1 Tax=Rhynchosporium secalis TaxID=38038 RepID=A0A1E1M2N3_RHYSE|nr:uncharacterized protein RSE6_03392 [Rhynchosporium secalis]